MAEKSSCSSFDIYILTPMTSGALHVLGLTAELQLAWQLFAMPNNRKACLVWLILPDTCDILLSGKSLIKIRGRPYEN